MEERVSRLEGAYEQVDRRLGDLTDAVNRVDAKVDALLSDMDARFDSLRSEMNSKFSMLMLIMATSGVAVAGSLVAVALRA